MKLDIKETGDIRDIIDQIIANQDKLHRQNIRINTNSGETYYGQLIERVGGSWLIVKGGYNSYMMEGAKKDEVVYSYSYISLPTITGVTYEVTEKVQ